MSKPVVRVPLASQAPLAEPKPVAEGEPGLALRPGIQARYLVIAGLLLIGILGWIGGVLYGRSQERASLEQELRGTFRDRPSPSEVGDSANQPRVQPAATNQANPRPAVPTATGPVISSRGMVAEPRTSGLNYLALAVLPRTDCESAIAFLSGQGLEAFAVPVDRNGSEVNNPDPGGRYRLYVLPGITGEQYSQRQTIRVNLETEVARLGKAWQKDHRGASNFASPGWIKFK